MEPLHQTPITSSLINSSSLPGFDAILRDLKSNEGKNINTKIISEFSSDLSKKFNEEISIPTNLIQRNFTDTSILSHLMSHSSRPVGPKIADFEPTFTKDRFDHRRLSTSLCHNSQPEFNGISATSSSRLLSSSYSNPNHNNKNNSNSNNNNNSNNSSNSCSSSISSSSSRYETNSLPIRNETSSRLSDIIFSTSSLSSSSPTTLNRNEMILSRKELSSTPTTTQNASTRNPFSFLASSSSSSSVPTQKPSTSPSNNKNININTNTNNYSSPNSTSSISSTSFDSHSSRSIDFLGQFLPSMQQPVFNLYPVSTNLVRGNDIHHSLLTFQNQNNNSIAIDETKSRKRKRIHASDRNPDTYLQCSGVNQKKKQRCGNSALMDYIGPRPHYCAEHIQLDKDSLYQKCSFVQIECLKKNGLEGTAEEDPGNTKQKYCKEVVLKEFSVCFKHLEEHIELDNEFNPNHVFPSSENSSLEQAYEHTHKMFNRCCELLHQIQEEAAAARQSDLELFQRKVKLTPKYQSMKQVLASHLNNLNKMKELEKKTQKS